MTDTARITHEVMDRYDAHRLGVEWTPTMERNAVHLNQYGFEVEPAQDWPQEIDLPDQNYALSCALRPAAWNESELPDEDRGNALVGVGWVLLFYALLSAAYLAWRFVR